MESNYKDQDPKGIKKANNMELLRLTEEIFDTAFLKKEGHVLYLDGPNLGSTEIFQDQFNNCTIAQMDKDEYSYMIQQNKHKNVNIQHCTIRNIVESNSEMISKCQLIYLDTMQIF